MHEAAREDILSYFLTEFPTDHPLAYVETIAKNFLLLDFSERRVDEFWNQHGTQVISDLVEEFDRRQALDLAIRYEPVDELGLKVVGRKFGDQQFHEFQNALLKLTANQFELLTATLLSAAGCQSFWATPASHDEGLDAFGIMKLPLLKGSPEENVLPSVFMLVQAKHYKTTKVHTADIRELVGSTELAKYRIYSTAAEKYSELEMRPLAPIAQFMICSGEITRTARGLAKRAGVFLLTAYDIFLTLREQWDESGTTLPETRGQILRLLKKEIKGIQTAS